MSHVFWGVFREEKCISFLLKCIDHVKATFLPLLSACKGRYPDGWVDKYGACLSLVETWSEDRFLASAKRLCDSDPGVEDCFRFSFATYVKHAYRKAERRTSPLRVRVSFPSLPAFLRLFLSRIASDPYFRTGRYFDAETQPIVRKDVCMDACRMAFAACLEEHVGEVDPPGPAAAPSGEGGEGGEEEGAAGEDELLPSDSVSQAGEVVRPTEAYRLNPALTQHIDSLRRAAEEAGPPPPAPPPAPPSSTSSSSSSSSSAPQPAASVVRGGGGRGSMHCSLQGAG